MDGIDFGDVPRAGPLLGVAVGRSKNSVRTRSTMHRRKPTVNASARKKSIMIEPTYMKRSSEGRDFNTPDVIPEATYLKRSSEGRDFSTPFVIPRRSTAPPVAVRAKPVKPSSTMSSVANAMPLVPQNIKEIQQANAKPGGMAMELKNILKQRSLKPRKRSGPKAPSTPGHTTAIATTATLLTSTVSSNVPQRAKSTKGPPPSVAPKPNKRPSVAVTEVSRKRSSISEPVQTDNAFEPARKRSNSVAPPVAPKPSSRRPSGTSTSKRSSDTSNDGSDDEATRTTKLMQLHSAERQAKKDETRRKHAERLTAEKEAKKAKQAKANEAKKSRFSQGKQISREKSELELRLAKVRAAEEDSTKPSAAQNRQEAERVETERVETARVEAERVQAERVQAKRIQAERVEAERVEAAQIMLELARQQEEEKVQQIAWEDARREEQLAEERQAAEEFAQLQCEAEQRAQVAVEKKALALQMAQAAKALERERAEAKKLADEHDLARKAEKLANELAVAEADMARRLVEEADCNLDNVIESMVDIHIFYLEEQDRAQQQSAQSDVELDTQIETMITVHNSEFAQSDGDQQQTLEADTDLDSQIESMVARHNVQVEHQFELEGVQWVAEQCRMQKKQEHYQAEAERVATELKHQHVDATMRVTKADASLNTQIEAMVASHNVDRNKRFKLVTQNWKTVQRQQQQHQNQKEKEANRSMEEQKEQKEEVRIARRVARETARDAKRIAEADEREAIQKIKAAEFKATLQKRESKTSLDVSTKPSIKRGASVAYALSTTGKRIANASVSSLAAAFVEKVRANKPDTSHVKPSETKSRVPAWKLELQRARKTSTSSSTVAPTIIRAPSKEALVTPPWPRTTINKANVLTAAASARSSEIEPIYQMATETPTPVVAKSIKKAKSMKVTTITPTTTTTPTATTAQSGSMPQWKKELKERRRSVSKQMEKPKDIDANIPTWKRELNEKVRRSSVAANKASTDATKAAKPLWKIEWEKRQAVKSCNTSMQESPKPTKPLSQRNSLVSMVSLMMNTSTPEPSWKKAAREARERNRTKNGVVA